MITASLLAAAGYVISIIDRAGPSHVAQGTNVLSSGGTGWVLGLVFDGLVALGTIGLAIVAVFQDRIRDRLARPRVRIKPHPGKHCLKCPLRNLAGDEIPAYWFGLAVTNEKPSRPARECTVLLEDMYRWNQTNHRWERNQPPIPYPYIWAPGHLMRSSVTIRRTEVFDFGKIIKQPTSAEPEFMPELLYRANSYDPALRQGQTGLYVLRVEAEHLAQGLRQVWQVSWDGIWNDDENEMGKHVEMIEIDLKKSQEMIQKGLSPEREH